MAKKFTQDEIYEDDIYGNLRNSLDTTIQKLKEADQAFIKFHQNINKTAQDLGTSAANVRQLNKANAESKATLEQKSNVEKQILKLEEQRNTVTQEQRQRLAELRLEQQRANKEAKAAVIANKGLETQYQKQSRTLNELRNRYKNLILEEGKSTKETRKLAKEITTLDRRLKAVDADVGQFQRSVGNYEKGLNKLNGTLGKLGIAFGAFTIARDVFNINKEFEASLASLSAITGVVGEEFKAFEQGVIDVASNTKKSATEVAGAFEIVGSAKPELLANADALGQVTEQAIILSQATGEQLESSAQSLTGTLNQFNLGAEEASRVINVLAAGSQAGAAPVADISASLDKFGTVAASLNVSVEESVGLIETLAEKNIKGAEAGTQLRNVLTTLATAETLPPKALEALEEYGVNTALVSDTTVSLQDRLKELSKIQNDANALNAVFGKSNLVAGQTLLQNVDSVQQYADAVSGTQTATEQAAINQDTLSAVLDQLRAAWENVVIQFTQGTGVFSVLKDVLKFVADNLETIIKVVATGVGVFAGYLAVTKAITAATKIWGIAQTVLNVILNANPIGLIVLAITALIAGIYALTDSFAPLINTLKNTFRSWEDFKKTIAAVGSLVLSLLDPFGLLDAALGNTAEATKKLTDEQRRNNIVNKKALEQGKQLLDQNKEEISDVSVLIDALNDENTTREERNEIIAKLNEDYPELIGNIDLETASTEQLINIKKELIKTILNQAIEEKKAAAISAFTARIIELELQKIGAGEAGIRELDRQIQELTLSLPLIEDIANKVRENLDNTVSGLDLSSSFREGNDKIRELQAELAELNKDLTSAIEAEDQERARKIRERIGKLNEELAILQGIRKKTLDDALDKEIQAENKASEETTKNAAKNAKKRLKTEAQIRQERFQQIQKDNDLFLQQLEANLLREGRSQNEISQILAAERISNLEDERAVALRLFGEFSAEYIKADLALQKALREADNETLARQKENQKKRFDDLNKIQENNLKILEAQLLESGKTREEIDKQLADQRIENLEDQKNRALAIFGEESDEFIEANLKLQKALEKQRSEELKAEEQRQEALKKAAQETVDIIKEVTDFIIADIDRRIDAGKKEIEASQDEQARLRELASQGNTDAAEALVAEKKREAKEKLNVEKLEKKKRNLLIVVAGLERASQLINSGDGNAFSNAGTQIKEFIAGLPQFYSGTNTTVADAIGKPHLNTTKDNYLIRAHGTEKILNPQLSAMTGDMTTEEIARAAMLWQNGALQRPTELSVQRPHENKKLIRAVEQNTAAIKNIRIVQQHIDLKSGTEVIVDGNKTTKVTHKKGLRFE